MLPRLLIIVLLLGLAADGADEGRKGNALYKAERFEAAVHAYRVGLEAQAGQKDALTTRLWNNLGAALHRLKRYDEAQQAFARALATAEEPADLARAAYNAGNNAAARGDLRAALAAYRKALLADPSHQRARFNYEYLKRRLREQRRRSQQRKQSSKKQRPRPSDQKNRSGTSKKDDTRRAPSEKKRNQRNSQEEQQQGAKAPQETPSPREASPRDARRRSSQTLTRTQALRILNALADQERKLLREMRHGEPQPRRVEKDW